MRLLSIEQHNSVMDQQFMSGRTHISYASSVIGNFKCLCYSNARVCRTQVVPTPAELFKDHIVLYHFLFSL